LGKFYVDSLVHDKRTLQFILATFGERSVALGSDYPFPLGEEKPGQLIESLGLTSEVEKRILCENALEWLGLSEKYL
jgi:aminocarboxymuconate-semialdehyde decarboxylase